MLTHFLHPQIYAVFMKSVYTLYTQCSIVVIQSQSNIFVNIVVTVVTHSQGITLRCV